MYDQVRAQVLISMLTDTQPARTDMSRRTGLCERYLRSLTFPHRSPARELDMMTCMVHRNPFLSWCPDGCGELSWS
jgi:hypothetical protein